MNVKLYQFISLVLLRTNLNLKYKKNLNIIKRRVLYHIIIHMYMSLKIYKYFEQNSNIPLNKFWIKLIDCFLKELVK